MAIGYQVFNESDELLADFSGRIEGLRFGTNKHGFAGCTGFVPMSEDERFAVYEWDGTPHVVVSGAAAEVVWEGRLEDIGIVETGVMLGAFGYWRAMSDIPYTALWSRTDYREWNESKEGSIYTIAPDLFKQHNNKGGLVLGLVKNTAYASQERCAFELEIPSTSSRTFQTVNFDYEFTASSDWKADLFTIHMISGHVWGFLTSDWTLYGNGATQSGTQSITISSSDNAVAFSLSAVNANTYTNETGVHSLKISNVRVKSTTATNVLSSDIAAALVSYVDGLNSGQISTSTNDITPTTTDLQDEIYEDMYPADILDQLALLENYRASVWENRQLYFGPASAGRSWYIDATKFEIERSLDNVRNSAYAKYRSSSGRNLRTANANDDDSQAQFGVVRRGFVNVRTSDQTEAETHRDAWLTDQVYPIRAMVEFDRLYDVYGAEFPLYVLRADDLIYVRNLPPTLSSTVDNFRSFRVGATEYDVDNNQIQVEPDVPTPTLVTLIAQKNKWRQNERNEQ